jgi:hypothetical protein
MLGQDRAVLVQRHAAGTEIARRGGVLERRQRAFEMAPAEDARRGLGLVQRQAGRDAAGQQHREFDKPRQHVFGMIDQPSGQILDGALLRQIVGAPRRPSIQFRRDVDPGRTRPGCQRRLHGRSLGPARPGIEGAKQAICVPGNVRFGTYKSCILRKRLK